MGEPIEITTWTNHQNIFYHITSNAVMFDVRATGNAVVGLAKRPGANCEYYVGIGDDSCCWIRKNNEHMKSVTTPSVVSDTEYRKFWIAWFGGMIRLGRGTDSKPIVTHPSNCTDLYYVTFTVLEDRNPVHWRFKLPPPRLNPKLQTISEGKIYWIEAGNQLPDEALIGGYERENLYIIRAAHQGSLTPGKFVPSEGVGYVSWGGTANAKEDFEVLCGYDCHWVQTLEDKIPVGAIEGGYSEDCQERLYIGRAVHEGHLIPGKVQPSHKVCYIPFDGKEVGKKRFEILVDPNHNKHCANKMYVSDMQVDSMSETDQDEEFVLDWRDELDSDD